MGNPVLHERIRQFQRIAEEDRRNFVTFAVLPSLFWVTVWVAKTWPSTHSIAGLFGGLFAIGATFLSVVVASWASGRDLPGNQRKAWWLLAFYLASPVLSWLINGIIDATA